jgi:hypothetical protein
MAGTLKVQLLETFAALITAAFGLVAAVAWNETIKSLVAMIFPNEDDTIWGNLVYAIIVTILAVVMTFWISRSLGKAKEALEAEKKE